MHFGYRAHRFFKYKENLLLLSLYLKSFYAFFHVLELYKLLIKQNL